jgi:hypothetical protein
MDLRRVGPHVGRHAIAVVLALCAVVAGHGHGVADSQTDALYTIERQPVDATAEDAAAARDAALAQGQATALQRLFERLVPASELARLPRLSQTEIPDLIQDFSIEGEKTSDVRYLASVTYRFKPQAVQQILRNAGVQFAETMSKPVVVLPLYSAEGKDVIWEDPNPWREAWQARPAEQGLVPLVVPLGDLEDMMALVPAQIVQPDLAALNAFAQRYGAQDTLVVRAIPEVTGNDALGSVRIEARRYARTGPVSSFEIETDASAGETPGDVYARAADQVSDYVQEDWKSRNLLQSGPAYWIAVSVPVAGLDEWLKVKRRIEAVPIVRSAEVQSLSRTEARLALVFYGRLDQLALALNQNDLSLRRGPGEWQIVPGVDPTSPKFSPDELNPPQADPQLRSGIFGADDVRAVGVPEHGCLALSAPRGAGWRADEPAIPTTSAGPLR